MKVCHLTSVHSAYDERIFLKECISLVKAGYEVSLIASNAHSEVINGVHIIGVKVKERGRLNRLLVVTKAIYKQALLINADIYHIHDPELLPFALILKRKGKKVIFDSHEDVVNQILQKKYLSIFRYFVCWLYKKYERLVLSKVDAVVSVTPHIVNRLRKINSNTVQITNYPLLEELYEGGVGKNDNRVVFAGGVSPLWLHDIIINSLQYVPDTITYTFAGPSSDQYINYLKSLEYWGQTEYLGVIHRKQVLQLYRNSLLGVAVMDYVANVGYNIGTLGNNKLFEFMSAGLPVICTDFILWREIIDKWECGIYVNAHDVQAIGNAINELHQNRNLAKKMGENGIRAVKEEYNWKTQEVILLNLYQELNCNEGNNIA